MSLVLLSSLVNQLLQIWGETKYKTLQDLWPESSRTEAVIRTSCEFHFQTFQGNAVCEEPKDGGVAVDA